MDQQLLQATRNLNLDQSHDKIYSNPNDLISLGFSSSFLMPLLQKFKSDNNRCYFRNGEAVIEMIGISHLALIYAIADAFGVPPSIGSGFSGQGFAMRAKIEAIRRALEGLGSAALKAILLVVSEADGGSFSKSFLRKIGHFLQSRTAAVLQDQIFNAVPPFKRILPPH